MGDLTRNFSRYEFACQCGCGFNTIDLTLVGALQVFRDMIGKRININSGCRCPAHNKAVYLALNQPEVKSYHMFGKAIDFTCDDRMDLAVIYARIVNWGGGVHFYPVSNFIHIDNGPYSRWEGK
jgi:uncharacterized protein YcbK (DUF882 family)